MLEDILDYLHDYEQRADIPWDVLSKRFNFKLKDEDGNIIPFDNVIVYVLLRKLLEGNITFTANNRNLYIAVLLKVLEIISCMDNQPIKTSLKLLLMLLDLYSPGIEYREDKITNRKSITKKTFEKIKNHLQTETSLTNKEIKIKIFQITKLKDPKSLRKYLKMYRDWEK